MRRRSFAVFALAFAFAMPADARAQYAPDAGNVMFGGDQGANGTVNGFAVGPYKAQIKDFSPMLANVLAPNFASIWCVDFDHWAPSMSSWDSYYATAFSANSAGNLGNGDFSKTVRYSGSHSAAEGSYRNAAWLIEQYYNVGGSTYTAANVQGTIWKMMGANVSGFTDLTSNVTNAGNFALTKDWYVLSDKIDCASQTCESQNQEFLTFQDRPAPTTVTPEPSTYALMAAGLLAMGAVARRRRTIA